MQPVKVGSGTGQTYKDVIAANVSLKPVPKEAWGYSMDMYYMLPYVADTKNTPQGATTPALLKSDIGYSSRTTDQPDGSVLVRATFVHGQ